VVGGLDAGGGARGQADLAVHANDLFEVWNETGATIYLSKHMRKYNEAHGKI
jgi:hypothetical protein